MQQEELFLNNSRTGTTAIFFSSRIKGDITNGIYPAYVLYNNNNTPTNIFTFDGNHLWSLDNRNINIPLSSVTTNYITGYCFTELYNNKLSESEKSKISIKFASAVLSGTTSSAGTLNSFVEFKDTLIDDFFATVKLTRTTDILSTLAVYNNLINSIPTQDSDTGIVFGKLEAIQTSIKNVDGSNIRIPLRNVPIGIFNPSTEFPLPTDLNDDGDRLFLNIKESAKEEEYFNYQSFTADTEYFLRSASEFTSVPPQYEYITKTNDNGEFVIYNAPIGTQIVVFEIDLLKQGLTKEEVALNFFPYPGDNFASVDEIPHFFYRQIEVDIVPAWGTLQTGYTELNIDINLDLRKWATYFIPPLSSRGETIDFLQQNGVFEFYNISVRDMSKENYPVSNISVVEIENMLDRVEDQALQWNNEITQIKNRIQFRTHDFHAFKLPANIYDPIGKKTDKFGNPTGTTGVWLAGYQFKLFFENSGIFRATGFHRDEFRTYTRNGYDLNKNNTDTSKSNSEAQGYLGAFPYEQPWDYIYPDLYNIPKTPSITSTTKQYDSTGQAVITEEPYFLDGDMPGRIPDNEMSGGYGLQLYPAGAEYISNRFSKRVTKDFIYKYEQGVSLFEEYSNGYQPLNPNFPFSPGTSNVLKGERWQRVEAGYSYFLKPEGWPKIENNNWGDVLYNPDLTSASIENFSQRDLALVLDTSAPITEGYLDIYRIVDSTPQNLVSPDPSVIKTYAKFNFMNFAVQRGKSIQRVKTKTSSNSNGDGEQFYVWNDSKNLSKNNIELHITNLGEKDITIPELGNIEIAAGQTKSFSDSDFGSFEFAVITLEGNSDFDFSDFSYKKAKYKMKFENVSFYNANGNIEGTQNQTFEIDTINLNASPQTSIPVYYLLTEWTNVRTTYNKNNSNCTGDFSGVGSAKVNTVRVNGMGFLNKSQNDGQWHKSFFDTTLITPTCTDSSPVIPFQVI